MPNPDLPPFRYWQAVWAVSRPIVRTAGALGWRLRFVEEAPMPDGPVVVAANHFSHLDIPVVAAAARRSIRFLALDELYGLNKPLDAVLAGFGPIPLSRERPPFGAMRTALAHLSNGGTVGVFPEGRRVEVWGQSPPKAGAAWLSLRASVPLVPMAVVGTDVAFGVNDPKLKRAPITVHVGAALRPSSFGQEQDPRAAMMAQWQDWVAKKLISKSNN